MKQALSEAKFQKSIDFAHGTDSQVVLDRSADLAMLFIRQPVPISRADDELVWTIKTQLKVEWPKEKKAVLRVTLRLQGENDQLAQVEHIFVGGSRRQEFVGRAHPPATGWIPGKYEVNTVLLTDRGEVQHSKPIVFELGLIHWNRTTLQISPEAVLASGFSVDTGVEVKRDDAIAIVAAGKLTPAPLGFYRELLVNPKLVARPAAQPTGIPWSNIDQITRKYRPVEPSANFAALLVKYSGTPWVGYEAMAHPLPSPRTGAIRLSINSLLPPATSNASDVNAQADRAYWQANSGKFDVALYRGRFAVERSLTTVERAGLLSRFDPVLTDKDDAP